MNFEELNTIAVFSCGLGDKDAHGADEAKYAEACKSVVDSVVKLKDRIQTANPDLKPSQVAKRIGRLFELNLAVIGELQDPGVDGQSAKGNYVWEIYTLAKGFKMPVAGDETVDQISHLVRLSLAADPAGRPVDPQETDIKAAFKRIDWIMKQQGIEPNRENYDTLVEALADLGSEESNSKRSKRGR